MKRIEGKGAAPTFNALVSPLKPSAFAFNDRQEKGTS